MIGRLLCRIGLHRWQVERSVKLDGGYLRDRQSCRRPGCTESYTYITHRSDPVNW